MLKNTLSAVIIRTGYVIINSTKLVSYLHDHNKAMLLLISRMSRVFLQRKKYFLIVPIIVLMAEEFYFAESLRIK